MNDNTLVRLVVVFLGLAVIAVGGTNTILPEMHHEVVAEEHWVTDEQFGACFAIAQAAPGPGTLIVTLIGYRAAGLLGAVAATLAMIVPPLTLTCLLTRIWEKARDSKWRMAIEHGLAPITVGLVFASGVVIMRTTDHGVAAYAATAVATLLFAATRINPLIVIGVCGGLGLLGWI
jgi:chromate transporter